MVARKLAIRPTRRVLPVRHRPTSPSQPLHPFGHPDHLHAGCRRRGPNQQGSLHSPLPNRLFGRHRSDPPRHWTPGELSSPRNTPAEPLTIAGAATTIRFPEIPALGCRWPNHPASGLRNLAKTPQEDLRAVRMGQDRGAGGADHAAGRQPCGGPVHPCDGGLQSCPAAPVAASMSQRAKANPGPQRPQSRLARHHFDSD